MVLSKFILGFLHPQTKQSGFPKRLHYKFVHNLHTSTTVSVKMGKPRKENRWSMHPDLHNKVMHLLEEHNLSFDFHEVDSPTHNTREYDTNIMGRFGCRNKKCASSGWSSKKIAITIRLYPNSNEYNARVWHQRCESCDQLGRLFLDEGSYAERVAYRLKKWKGIEMERPAYTGKSDGPHQSALCEGCKAGHCKELDPY